MKDGNISMLVYNLLAEERAYQDRKFGQCPIATDHEFLAIAGEEFGELCRAICQRRSAAEINKEAKQLAATCIAYLDHDLHWSNKLRKRNFLQFMLKSLETSQDSRQWNWRGKRLRKKV